MKTTSIDSNSRHWILATLVLISGCGEGLLREVRVDTLDGGVEDDAATQGETGEQAAATLGKFGRVCGSLDNSQIPLWSFSPQSDIIARANGAGRVELRAVSDGHLLQAFEAHAGQVTALAFSPKENLLVTGGIDGVVRLWRDGSRVDEVPVSGLAIEWFAWSHDGTALLVTTRDKVARYQIIGGRLAPTWNSSAIATSAPFFNSDDSTVLIPSEKLRILVAKDGTEQVPFSISPWQVAASPDGSWMANLYVADATVGASDGYDYTLDLYQLTVGPDGLVLNLKWRQKMPARPHLPNGPTFSANSQRLVVTRARSGQPGDQVLNTVFNTEDGSSAASIPNIDEGYGLLFSPDGKLALTRTGRLIDLATGSTQQIVTLAAQSSVVRAVSAAADGSRLVCADTRLENPNLMEVDVWDVSQRKVEVRLPVTGFTGADRGPVISPAGDVVAFVEFEDASGSVVSSVNTNPFVRVQFLNGQRPPLVIESYNPMDLAFSADGRVLAVANLLQHTVSLYSVDDGSLRNTIDLGVGLEPGLIALSPDGADLAVTHPYVSTANTAGFGLAKDRTLDASVWRISDGQKLWGIAPHDQAPMVLVYSPDGALLLMAGVAGVDAFGNRTSGSNVGLALLDARTGALVHKLAQPDLFAESVSFSPDGKLLAAPSDGGIVVWRTSDWQRYDTLGMYYSQGYSSPMFLGSGTLLDASSGVLWCSP